MSDQLTPELEARVRAWLGARAPSDVPPDFVERIMAIPSAAPSAGSRNAVRMIAAGRRSSPRYLAALVAILALALIAGGIILTAATRRDPFPTVVVLPTAMASGPVPSGSAPMSAAPASDAPVSSAQVALGDWPADFRSGGLLPAAAPAGAEHGTIQTPLGRARWVHLKGDIRTVPDPLVPILAPDDTIVWFARGGPGDTCYNAPSSSYCKDPPKPSLSVSTDLLAERTPKALPVDVAQADFVLVDGMYWFIPTGSTQLWRSADLSSWVRTDVSGLRSPGPAGLDWRVSIWPVASIGGTTVATVQYDAVDPAALLGHPGVNVNLRKDDAGGYVAREFHLMRDGGDRDLGPVTVDETVTGIRFLDGDGRELGRLDGVGPEFAEMWATRGLTYQELAVAQDDRWASADLGPAGLADWPLIVQLPESVAAFVLEADQHVRMWRTADGITWTGGSLLTADDGTAIASSGVTYRESEQGPVIVAFDIDGTNAWHSTDGEVWTKGADSQDQIPATRLAHGWIRTADQVEDGTWHVSSDGATWEAVPALQSVVTKVAPDGAGGSSESAIGNTLFFSVEEAQSPFGRDLWVMEFEEPAG